MKPLLTQRRRLYELPFLLCALAFWYLATAVHTPKESAPATYAAPRVATTNGFDSYAAGARLTSQIAGVIFPDGAIVRAATSLGIGARSAPNVLQKDCFEFDDAAFRIQFTSAQGMVRAYVGNREAFAIKVVMRGYDALNGGNLIGVSEVGLGAGASVTTPLEICRATARDIRRVEITATNAVCEIIDDLTWDPAPELGTISTVNFDERVDRTRISTQYAGLNFPDSPWIRTASAMGLTAGSAPNVLEQYSFGLEFDPAPLRIQFTPAQAWVRVLVGNSFQGSSPRITMRVYNVLNGGTPIAVVYTDRFSATINTPLEVCRLMERDIRRIEIQQDPSVFEVIDTLQFAGAAPPPPPPDNVAPRAFLDSPRATDCLLENTITLAGRITENVALERVSLVHEQMDGAGRKEYDLLALRGVTGSAPNFVIGFRVTLFSGRNRLRVEATDTSSNRATNAEREIILTLSPAMQVLIDTPTPGQVFANSPITITGRVQKPCGVLPRDRVRSTVVNGVGDTSGPGSADAVSGAAPEFRFSDSINLLSARIDESNTITVEATAEDGTTARATVAVVYSRPDLRVSGLEVTQATELDSSLTGASGSGVPMVAGKRTVARIFPQTVAWRGGDDVSVSQAQLVGRRGGVELPGSPIVRNATRTAGEGDLAVSLRPDVNSSWNILLPDEWTREGELELSATINPNRAVTECANCYGNNEFLRTRIAFQAATTLRLVPVIIDRGAGMPIVTVADFASTFEGIRRAYPVTTLDIRPARILRTNDNGVDLLDTIADEYTCFDNDFFGSIWDWVQDCDWDKYHVGLLPVTAAGCPGGMAYVNSPVCYTEATPWVAAQEVGHCLGREHAGNDHGEAGGGGFDAAFPHPHGRIGLVGFDTVAMQAIPVNGPFPAEVPTLSDPCREGAAHAHDFMSYGDGPKWISPYTYRALLNSGFRGDSAFNGSGQNAIAPEPPVYLQSQSGVYLHISGKFMPDGTVELRPFITSGLPTGKGVRQGSGPYTVEILNRGGQILFSGKFDHAHSTHQEPKITPFNTVVPMPSGAARILIRNGNTLLASRDVSANAPEIRLLSPNGGEQFPATGLRAVNWMASDADGDALTFALQYSADNGKTWQMLASQLRVFSYDLDVAQLPGSAQARIRVVASDGVNTSRDVSDASFTVPRKAPQVTIFAPAESGVIPPNQMVMLEGVAADYETADLQDAALNWTSDRDGALGAGRRVNVAQLSTGVHVITLTARDSDGQTGRDSVTVLVPSAGAGHVSAASFRQAPLASEMIVGGFGVNLATTTAVASSLPLPTELAGVRVVVSDRAGAQRLAPLFFVSRFQINYLMPAGLAPGAATITTTLNNNVTTTSPALITDVAPGVFTANANGQGAPAAVALRVSASGAQSYEPVAEFDQKLNRFVPRPLDLGAAGDQVYLILFGTGFRGSALSEARATIGGEPAEMLFVGAVGGLEGLDQLNLRLPTSLRGRGEVEIFVHAQGIAANHVTINVK